LPIITVLDGAVILKGSLTGWGTGGVLQKTSAPLSLMTAYRMSLISSGTISLNSASKGTGSKTQAF
jgi:hypothetical protein